MTFRTIQKPEEPVVTRIEQGKAEGSYCSKASSLLSLTCYGKTSTDLVFPAQHYRVGGMLYEHRFTLNTMK